MNRLRISLVPVLLVFLIISCTQTSRSKSDMVDGKPGFIIEAWADNWFAFYLGETLILEDSVSINTERSFNAERKVFSGNYPLQLNFILKDYKADDTGLEYLRTKRQQIGDGGFAMQILDRRSGETLAVSNQQMKCKVIHKAPLDEICADSQNPMPGKGSCQFKSEDAPTGWLKKDFNDSSWANAREFSKREVRPKDGYDKVNWDSRAKLIWSDDLKKDNTLLCRLTLNKPMSGSDENSVAVQSSLSPSSTSFKSTVASELGSPKCEGKDLAFQPYAKNLEVECDETYMYIKAESIGNESMMVGITLWNHQVPIPQDFKGSNRWRIPLHPERLKKPVPTVGQGPIAVAIDGVMIYNPTKQDGVYSVKNDPYLIGELGICGGHSGRADDYHYHVAPDCIISKLPKNYAHPIAYALDGYPVYSYLDPDGSVPLLDQCGGHEDLSGNYHYHVQPKAPYVLGCFTGKFDLSLQPHTQAVREPNPLGQGPAVKITKLDFIADKTSRLEYLYQGKLYSIAYTPSTSGCYKFEFFQGNVVKKSSTYCKKIGSNIDKALFKAGQPPKKDSIKKRRYCGDNICDNTESKRSCPRDCSGN